MVTDATRVHAFEIKYETEASLPAPYAHFYHLQATINLDNQLHIDYHLQYLGREELTEEEIAGEGFTPNDDFRWQGTLPAVWMLVVQQLLGRTTLRTDAGSDQDPYFSLVINDGGLIREGTPANRSDWEYTAQELIQAIYEMAQREAPLQLQFKKINSDGFFWRLALILHFSTRRVEVTQETSTGKNQWELDWGALKNLLRTVYMPDYLPNQAQTKEPRKPGTFLDSGDGLWYEFGVSARNPGKKRDVLSEIDQLFTKLAE